ncbi:ester cyclase [Amycolatopsis sp. WQ 127309]|uniref:ester cyclase n=1 Tax=Amycolatopsis sp. WQ 127309 TaxID=2932773 RepID=UPI001FF58469|nr:ester cyclase [Amycolatopsis sp. WQ 127309]UOZ03440.1 ester cyclase [Amycolatopsis sp. WQ 127309]
MSTNRTPLSGLVETLAASATEYTAEEQRNIEIFTEFRSSGMERRREFTTDDFVRHQHGIVHIGKLNPGGSHGMTPDSIPDRVDEIVDVIAKGDRVWALWYVTGTHDGDVYGIAATGKPVRMLELGVWRFVDGKMAEAWFFADELGLLVQLGKVTGPVR